MAETRQTLAKRTRADLREIGRELGLSGISSMKKDELVDAIVEAGPQRRVDGGHRIRASPHPKVTEDRLTLQPVGGGWFRLDWQITAEQAARAEKALGRSLWSSRTVLRVTQVADPAITLSEEPVRSGDELWYVHVDAPADAEVRAALVLVGDAADPAEFTLVRSAIVAPPPSRTAEPIPTVDPLSEEILEEIYRLHGECEPFSLQIAAELNLVGTTQPGTQVTAGGFGTAAAADGRFSLRVPLEPGRTVLPLEAVAPNKRGHRTGVASVDLNLRVLLPSDEE